jgi:hypothetical protein
LRSLRMQTVLQEQIEQLGQTPGSSTTSLRSTRMRSSTGPSCFQQCWRSTSGGEGSRLFWQLFTLFTWIQNRHIDRISIVSWGYINKLTSGTRIVLVICLIFSKLNSWLQLILVIRYWLQLTELN